MQIQLALKKNKRNRFIIQVLLLIICAIGGWRFARNFKIRPAMATTFIPVNLPASDQGKLHLLTYNIAGLPQIISSAKTPRVESITEIGKLINQFDVVNIQEDFNYNRYLYAENNHNYRSENMGGVPFGDGLTTLSKYPMLFFERVSWKDCNGADCLTPKGFSFSRIQLAKSVFVDIYNVHATAQIDENAALARTKNMNQLKHFIEQNSATNPVIVMGDFNAHYSYERDNVIHFQKELNLKDTWVMLKNENTFPKVNAQFVETSLLELTDNCESIDKIYFRNSTQLTFEPKAYHIEKELFKDENGSELSDHCAVSAILDWKLKK